MDVNEITMQIKHFEGQWIYEIYQSLWDENEITTQIKHFWGYWIYATHQSLR